MKRVAAKDPLYSKKASLCRPIFFNSNHGIFRTRRNIPARRRLQRRKEHAIKPNEKKQNDLHRLRLLSPESKLFLPAMIPAFLPKARKAFSNSWHLTARAAFLPNRPSPEIRSNERHKAREICLHTIFHGNKQPENPSSSSRFGF